MSDMMENLSEIDRLLNKYPINRKAKVSNGPVVMDRSLSPTKINGLSIKNFIGQSQIVDLLSVAMISAKKNNKPLDHILLYGGPGLGKSLLARTIGCEMNCYYKEFLGSELREKNSVQELFSFLTTNYTNKCIFIDEVHNINLKSAELLYEAMQDFSIRGEKIEPFTMIAATTYSGKIFKPLRERFTYALKLETYTTDELVLLINKTYTDLPSDVALFVAERSKSIPRICNHYIKKILSAASAEGKPVNMKHASFIMNVLGVNSNGLNQDDINVLVMLRDNKLPMSRNTICSVLNVDSSDYDWLIEPHLLSLGLIQIVPRGRMLTDNGRIYLSKMGI